MSATTTAASKSRHDHWNTPREVLDPLGRFWPSGIDLDPCSNETSVVESRVECGAHRAGHPTANGLEYPWFLPEHGAPTLVYVNPPYSKPGPWVERAARESMTGLCHVVMLIPATTSTSWWQAWVWPHAAAVGFMRQRVAFLDERGRPVKGNRFETALVYYGPEAQRFARVFQDLAEVVRPGGWS